MNGWIDDPQILQGIVMELRANFKVEYRDPRKIRSFSSVWYVRPGWRVWRYTYSPPKLRRSCCGKR